MAQIELRNASIRIVDGYTNTGNVNDVAIAAGDTTLVVNNIVGQIPNFAKMVIANVNRTYRVTSATGNPTTQVTFAPPLAVADVLPVNGAAITFGGRFVEAKIGDGTLSYTENKEMEYRLNKGKLDTVREGDDQPLEVSLDFVWEFLLASVGLEPSLEDAIKKRGEAATWVSSDTVDPCTPYAVDVEIEHDPPCGGAQRELIVLPDFRYESLEHNAVDAQVSMTGRCNAKEGIITRLANS